MNPYVQNYSCVPFTPSSQPCELGNYASYSISVTGADDVIAGIKFARENNIRLVIKNTGHEYDYFSASVVDRLKADHVIVSRASRLARALSPFGPTI